MTTRPSALRASSAGPLVDPIDRGFNLLRRRTRLLFRRHLARLELLHDGQPQLAVFPVGKILGETLNLEIALVLGARVTFLAMLGEELARRVVRRLVLAHRRPQFRRRHGQTADHDPRDQHKHPPASAQAEVRAMTLYLTLGHPLQFTLLPRATKDFFSGHLIARAPKVTSMMLGRLHALRSADPVKTLGKLAHIAIHVLQHAGHIRQRGQRLPGRGKVGRALQQVDLSRLPGNGQAVAINGQKRTF
jgi:enamine deaminase RidA (YjgF/YER057c/UK114 family)